MTSRPCEVCDGVKFSPLHTKDKHEFFRCRSCRLVRIDPQPTDELLADIYGAKYYDDWGVQTDAGRVLELKKTTFRKYVLGAVNLKPRARVLDCGAAFGALMEVAQEIGWEAYGIELSPAAATHITRQFGTARIFAGPFEQASFPEIGASAFDAIFMCDFIEHVRDPLATLRQAAQLLGPAGQLVITTPDTGSPSCHLMGASWPHYNVQHLFCFNRRNLTQLLTRAGFVVTHTSNAKKVVDVEYLNHHLTARRHPLMTPAVNLFARILGRQLRTWPLAFPLGQMLCVATRTSPTYAD